MLAPRVCLLMVTWFMGCTSGANVAAPPSAVSGTWINGFVNARASGSQPVNLSTAEIAAWTWNAAGGGWRRFDGAGTNQGGFEVPAVPGGPFVLEVRLAGSLPTFFESEAGLRDLDLGHDGQADLSAPRAGPGTILDLAVSNLSPLQKSDILKLSCDVGLQWLEVGSTVGDTSKQARIQWAGLPLLGGDDPAECVIQQVRLSTLEGGGGVNSVLAAQTTRDLRTIDGRLTMFSSVLQPLTPEAPVKVEVRRSRFDVYRSDVGAQAGEPQALLNFNRRPPGSKDTNPANLTLSLRTGPGADDTIVEGQETNPYPASWPLLIEAGVLHDVHYDVPMAPASAGTGVAVRTVDLAENVIGRPVEPTLSPPRALRIGGKSAQEQRPGVGLTPLITWDAPALGKPTVYRLSIYGTERAGVGIATPTVATVYTDRRAFRVPPDLLEADRWYLVHVTAITSRAARAAAPMRESLPYATADTLSAGFSP